MTNQSWDYIHGYSDLEQERLIQQAEYWREDLILKDINYQAGTKLLEIGCGAGAVLGILGTTFPDLQLAGIDLEAKQIAYAKQHLAKLGLTKTDLQVGDASQLLWNDNTFDEVYAIWFLEHLTNPVAVLQEAKRVLKPGGTITLTETDYRTIIVSPHSADYQYLQNSLCELLLLSGGNPYIGQSLDNLCSKVGLKNIVSQTLCFHFSSSQNQPQLQNFIAYVNSWLAPTVPPMIEKMGKEPTKLRNGLKWFRNIGNKDNDAATIIIYRVVATK